jgi:uncharacterized membrane protein
MYGGILLLVLVAIPGVSSFLNITRFLHVALMLLAPILVVALRPRYLASFILIYFLFTSGIVFEATQQNNIRTVTIPYNVGISDYRIDLGATITNDDLTVQHYIKTHNLFPLLSDIHGSDLIGEAVGWRDDLNVALFRDVYTVHNCYVFVRSRNVRDGTFTIWNGVGCRRAVDPLDYGIDWTKNIVFQSGDARVIRID